MEIFVVATFGKHTLPYSAISLTGKLKLLPRSQGMTCLGAHMDRPQGSCLPAGPQKPGLLFPSSALEDPLLPCQASPRLAVVEGNWLHLQLCTSSPLEWVDGPGGAHPFSACRPISLGSPSGRESWNLMGWAPVRGPSLVHSAMGDRPGYELSRVFMGGRFSEKAVMSRKDTPKVSISIYWLLCYILMLADYLVSQSTHQQALQNIPWISLLCSLSMSPSLI